MQQDNYIDKTFNNGISNSNTIITNEYVLVKNFIFRGLTDYSSSHPSLSVAGKVWKKKSITDGKWYLCWYNAFGKDLKFNIREISDIRIPEYLIPTYLINQSLQDKIVERIGILLRDKYITIDKVTSIFEMLASSDHDSVLLAKVLVDNMVEDFNISPIENNLYMVKHLDSTYWRLCCYEETPCPDRGSRHTYLAFVPDDSAGSLDTYLADQCEWIPLRKWEEDV